MNELKYVDPMAAMERLFQTVRNFKTMGLPVEQIALATGLSAAEMEALQ